MWDCDNSLSLSPEGTTDSISKNEIFSLCDKSNLSALARLTGDDESGTSKKDALLVAGDVDGSVVLFSYQRSAEKTMKEGIQVGKVNIIHKTKANENQGDFIGV